MRHCARHCPLRTETRSARALVPTRLLHRWWGLKISVRRLLGPSKRVRKWRAERCQRLCLHAATCADLWFPWRVKDPSLRACRWKVLLHESRLWGIHSFAKPYEKDRTRCAYCGKPAEFMVCYLGSSCHLIHACEAETCKRRSFIEAGRYHFPRRIPRREKEPSS